MKKCLVLAWAMMVLAVPVFGGGIYTGSSFNNDTGTSGNAWANFYGQNVKVTTVGSTTDLWLNGDPATSDAYFELRVNMLGNILTDDELPSGGSGGGGGGGNSGHLTVSHVTWYNYETGESQLYQFSPALDLHWNTSSWFNYNEFDDIWSGGGSGDGRVTGGVFTSTSMNFNETPWTDAGPEPDWWTDWSSSMVFTGIITADTWVAVPEPTSLALMALGGIAAIWRRKHRIA